MNRMGRGIRIDFKGLQQTEHHLEDVLSPRSSVLPSQHIRYCDEFLLAFAISSHRTFRFRLVESKAMPVTDADLVQQIIAGDELAMRALIERHQRVVFSLCLRMVRHQQDAEDITQESFLRAFRSLNRWDTSRSFRPWLLAIAANRCRTHFQKARRRPIAAEFVEETAVDQSKPDHSDVAEEIDIALAGLRESYRMSFVLFYQQDLPINEIAEVLETREGTVKTWLHRARKELAEHLSRRGFGPESNYGLPVTT